MFFARSSSSKDAEARSGSDTPTITLRGFGDRELASALSMACNLRDDYPERRGVRDGVGYRYRVGEACYVLGYAYRTAKGAIVVVRS